MIINCDGKEIEVTGKLEEIIRKRIEDADRADSLSKRIALRLKALEMTQKDLAKASGITQAAVSRYMKSDRMPTGRVLVSICKALEVTPNWLLGWEEE